MKIETYEIEQHDNDVTQLLDDATYLNLVEELGLEGQKKQFIDVDNKESVVFPYPRMTQLQQRVFEIHCPHKTKLVEYKSEMIPVRVLQVAQHALSCRFLKDLYVWHPTDAKLDPVLVGTAGSYGNDLYLLARWGAVWKDFPTLLREAKAEWKRIRGAKLKKAEQEIALAKAGLDSDTELHFSEGSGNFVSSSVYF